MSAPTIERLPTTKHKGAMSYSTGTVGPTLHIGIADGETDPDKFTWFTDELAFECDKDGNVLGVIVKMDWISR